MTQATPPKVLCVGRVYCDLVFTGLPHLPQLGQETFAQGLDLSAGGGAFITAATIAALGGEAALCATLPSAPFDTVVAKDIARMGVDATLCVSAPSEMSPQITVASVHEGDRAFLTHVAGPALPDTAWPAGLDHLHIGELRTLVDHPDLIARARAAGLSVSLDCGWDDALMAQGASLAGLIASVDVFFPNASEYDALMASGMPARPAPVTVIKDGAKGARASDGGAWHSLAALRVPVVDTTGAGDAFNGGFLTAWLAGRDLALALDQGNRCGAAVVSQTGGTAGLKASHHLLVPTPEAAE